MFFAVIVELADSHFRDFVLPCISPYPFGVDFIFLSNLLGSVVLGDVEVVFRNQSLVSFLLLSINFMSARLTKAILPLIRDALSLSSLTN